MTKILAVTTSKGGEGKTKHTICLAGAIAQELDKRVLVIDADNQGSVVDLRNADIELAASENESLTEDQIDVPYDVIEFNLESAQEAAKSLLERKPEYGTLSKATSVAFVLKLKQIVSSEEYDYILIDTPRITSVKDELVAALLIMCDGLLIPIRDEDTTILSTVRFTNIIDKIKESRANKGLDSYIYAFANATRGNENQINAYMSNCREICDQLGIDMLDNGVKQVKVISNNSTLDNILSSKDGNKYYRPFFNEVCEKLNID